MILTILSVNYYRCYSISYTVYKLLTYLFIKAVGSPRFEF